jgi:hypothetical protein
LALSKEDVEVRVHVGKLNLTGTWFHEDHLIGEVHIQQTRSNVVAKFADMRECGGFPLSNSFFKGKLVKQHLENGLVDVCRLTRIGPFFKPSTLPVKMNFSSDGCHLWGCYYDDDDGGPNPYYHHFELRRLFTPVEIKLRVFIPAPAIIVVPPVGVLGQKLADRLFFPNRGVEPYDPLLQGDNRGIDYEKGTSRVELITTVIADPQVPSGVLEEPWIRFGTTHEYTASDGQHVKDTDFPWWWWEIKKRGHPRHVEQLQPDENNSGIDVVRVDDETISARLWLNASLPSEPDGLLRRIAAHIGADIRIQLRERKYMDYQGARVTLNGMHKRFPAYELYLNGHSLYNYSPLENDESPLALAFPLHSEIAEELAPTEMEWVAPIKVEPQYGMAIVSGHRARSPDVTMPCPGGSFLPQFRRPIDPR